MKISLVLRFFFFFLWHYNYITLPLHIWKKAGFIIGEGNGNPLQCSCLENPRDGGAWWAAVYGVAQSRTRLKRLSSSICKWEWVEVYICWLPSCVYQKLGIIQENKIPTRNTPKLATMWLCFPNFYGSWFLWLLPNPVRNIQRAYIKTHFWRKSHWLTPICFTCQIHPISFKVISPD